MGLFDMFKKKEAVETAAPAISAGIEVEADADTLCSPVPGRAIAMADVPDPVFSGEVLGKGCAIWPEGDVVYAPVNGKVTVKMDHAVGIMSDSGIEALVHVGVETVNLQGKGFTGYVDQGDQIIAGQPILKMDRSIISEAGYKDCVVLAVSNSAEFEAVEISVEPGAVVSAGAAVLKVARK